VQADGGMTDPLTIDRLTVRVPGRRAMPAIIEELTLSVRPAEVLGIVGESGSGKTTLARAIMGLVRASAGRIAIEGEGLPDLAERSFRRLRRHVALIFQNPAGSFNPRLTVDAILREAVRGLGGGRSPTALLAIVGLDAPSACAQWRTGAAGGDCPGAGGRPGGYPGRRADRRPRRVGAGRDDEPAARPARRARHRHRLHHP